MNIDINQIKSPTKLLLCNKCKDFCKNINSFNNFKFCYICQCETNGCISSWYICSHHGCRYNTINKRFHEHFQNPDHLKHLAFSTKQSHDNTNNSLDVCDTNNDTILEYWNDGSDDETEDSQSNNICLYSECVQENKRIKITSTRIIFFF